MDDPTIIVIIPRRRRSKCNHRNEINNSIATISTTICIGTKIFGFCIKCNKTLVRMRDDFDSWREFKVKEDSL